MELTLNRTETESFCSFIDKIHRLCYNSIGNQKERERLNMNFLHRLREIIEDGKNHIEELVEEENNLTFVNKLDETELKELVNTFIDKYEEKIDNIKAEHHDNRIDLMIGIANNDDVIFTERILKVTIDDYYVYRNEELDKELTKKLRDYLIDRFEADYYKKVMYRK